MNTNQKLSVKMKTIAKNQSAFAIDLWSMALLIIACILFLVAFINNFSGNYMLGYPIGLLLLLAVFIKRLIGMSEMEWKEIFPIAGFFFSKRKDTYSA